MKVLLENVATIASAAGGVALVWMISNFIVLAIVKIASNK